MITDKDREDAKEIIDILVAITAEISDFSDTAMCEAISIRDKNRLDYLSARIAFIRAEAAEEARREAADRAVEWVNKCLCDEHMPIMCKRLEEDDLRAAIFKEATE